MNVHLLLPSQHESFVDLLCDLHGYYHDGLLPSREQVCAHLVNHLLAADSPIRLVVAHDNDDKVIGFAAITLTYSLIEPTLPHCRQCQLKELYVLPSARSQGVGKAIMSWIARYAIDNNCARIDWPVQAANSKGIAFYTSLGAEQVIERISFRLSEINLKALANQT